MALNRDKNEETANQDPDLSVEHDTEPETVEEVKVNSRFLFHKTQSMSQFLHCFPN